MLLLMLYGMGASLVNRGGFPPIGINFSDQADQLADQGRHEEALRQYRLAIMMMPEVRLYDRVGSSNFQLGNFAEAAEGFQAAITMDASEPSRWHNWVSALQAKGDREQAYSVLIRALERHPQSVDLRMAYGELLESNGQIPDAIAQYRQVIQIQSDHADAHTALGSIFADADQNLEAEASYREAIKADPRHALANNNLGVLLAGKRAFAEAAKLFKISTEEEANNEEFRDNLASALLDAGQLQEAREQFRILSVQATTKDVKDRADAMLTQLSSLGGDSHEN